MSRVSKLWRTDPDPTTAALEHSLFSLGRESLQAVHRSVHLALGLPRSLELEQVAHAYHGVVAKAPGPDRDEAWNRAASQFARIKARGEVGPREYRALSEAAAEKWYAEGRLESRARTHAVAAYLRGEMRAAGKPKAMPAQLTRNLDHAYASERAAEHVQNMGAKTRHALNRMLLGGSQNRTYPERQAGELLDVFAGLNRDWRRVAVTETAINRSNGFLAGLPVGRKVRWSPAADACPKCRQLKNKVFRVVAADKEDKDGLSEVWAGKTPIGRRDPLAWPAIPLHPHCRCRYLLELEHETKATPEIEDALSELLKRAREG